MLTVLLWELETQICIWAETAKRLDITKKLPSLAAGLRPGLTAFNNNGELEGNISLVELGRKGGRRDTDDDLFRAELKIRLDGPKPDSLLIRRPALPPQPSMFCLRVQQKYMEMWGSRDLSRSATRRAANVVPVVDIRKGVAAKVNPDKPRKASEAAWIRERRGQLSGLVASPPGSSGALRLPQA